MGSIRLNNIVIGLDHLVSSACFDQLSLKSYEIDYLLKDIILSAMENKDTASILHEVILNYRLEKEVISIVDFIISTLCFNIHRFIYLDGVRVCKIDLVDNKLNLDIIAYGN